MGDGAYGWTRRSATERSEGRGNGCPPEWAGPGRERREGEGREASGPAGEVGQQTKNEDGRGDGKEFPFLFPNQISKFISK